MAGDPLDPGFWDKMGSRVGRFGDAVSKSPVGRLYANNAGFRSATHAAGYALGWDYAPGEDRKIGGRKVSGSSIGGMTAGDGVKGSVGGGFLGTSGFSKGYGWTASSRAWQAANPSLIGSARFAGWGGAIGGILSLGATGYYTSEAYSQGGIGAAAGTFGMSMAATAIMHKPMMDIIGSGMKGFAWAASPAWKSYVAGTGVLNTGWGIAAGTAGIAGAVGGAAKGAVKKFWPLLLMEQAYQYYDRGRISLPFDDGEGWFDESVGKVFSYQSEAGGRQGKMQNLHTGFQKSRRMKELELGMPIVDEYGTMGTLRQRSLQAIQSSRINGRVGLGNEAAILH